MSCFCLQLCKKKIMFFTKKVIIKVDCKSFFPRHGQTIISNENNYIVECIGTITVLHLCTIQYRHNFQ